MKREQKGETERRGGEGERGDLWREEEVMKGEKKR